MKQNFNINLPDNEIIKVSIYGNNPDEYKYHLIYVHGFKGFKDWGFIPYMADYFEKRGIFTITFNFSLNGIGEKEDEFTEIDKFAKNTFSREVFELSYLLEKYKEGYFGKFSDKQLTLLGHSRGGAISIFCANNPLVNKVVLWASIAKLDRYTERQKQQWKKDGYVEVINTRTNQVFKLNVTLLDDIEKNKDDKLSIQKALSTLYKPILIAHGSNDLTVPMEESYQIYEMTNKNYSKHLIIDKASHTFDINHPFNGSNNKFDLLLNETYNFITS